METVENGSVKAFGIEITETSAKVLIIVAVLYILKSLEIFDAWGFIKGALSGTAAATTQP